MKQPCLHKLMVSSFFDPTDRPTDSFVAKTDNITLEDYLILIDYLKNLLFKF